MKKAFEFLIARKFSDRTDIEDLERNYGLILPKIFRCFGETFDLGVDKLNIDRYLDEDNDLSQLGSVKFEYEHGTVYLNDFLDLGEIFLQWNGAIEDEEWKKHKLLKIATLGQVGFGGLYVGCDVKNYDQVWIYNADKNKKFLKLSDNIFQFVSMLAFSSDFSNLGEENYPNLYKRWAEDFWRLK